MIGCLHAVRSVTCTGRLCKRTRLPGNVSIVMMLMLRVAAVARCKMRISADLAILLLRQVMRGMWQWRELGGEHWRLRRNGRRVRFSDTVMVLLPLHISCAVLIAVVPLLHCRPIRNVCGIEPALHAPACRRRRAAGCSMPPTRCAMHIMRRAFPGRPPTGWVRSLRNGGVHSRECNSVNDRVRRCLILGGGASRWKGRHANDVAEH